jgi:hypothetical protein
MTYFGDFLEETGTNNINANGDYSGGEVIFTYQNTGNSIISIKKIIVFIYDNKDFPLDKYGKSSVLTNGIFMYKMDINGNKIDYIDSRCPVKNNGDWGIYSDNVVDFSLKGVTSSCLEVGWGLEHIRLVEGESINISLEDDFTGIDKHLFRIEGYH